MSTTPQPYLRHIGIMGTKDALFSPMAQIATAEWSKPDTTMARKRYLSWRYQRA